MAHHVILGTEPRKCHIPFLSWSGVAWPILSWNFRHPLKRVFGTKGWGFESLRAYFLCRFYHTCESFIGPLYSVLYSVEGRVGSSSITANSPLLGFPYFIVSRT